MTNHTENQVESKVEYNDQHDYETEGEDDVDGVVVLYTAQGQSVYVVFGEQNSTVMLCSQRILGCGFII